MVKKSPERAQSFENAVAELESIVAAMERGDLPLEEALSRYQKGMDLLRQCRETLAAAEQRVRMLAEGQLVDLPEGDARD